MGVVREENRESLFRIREECVRERNREYLG